MITGKNTNSKTNMVVQFPLYSAEGLEKLGVARDAAQLQQSESSKGGAGLTATTTNTVDSYYLSLNRDKLRGIKNTTKGKEHQALIDNGFEEIPVGDASSQEEEEDPESDASDDEPSRPTSLDDHPPPMTTTTTARETVTPNININQDETNHSMSSTFTTTTTTTTTISSKRKATTNTDHRHSQMGRPPQLQLCLSSSSSPRVMNVPSALLADAGGASWSSMVTVCDEYLRLAHDISRKGKPVVVLLLRSGRFAGAVFQQETCIVHRACQRYTVRRGQGGAQGSNDNSKGKAKSMGAQLRRAGEEKLRRDVKDALLEWQDHLRTAALILISCPKTMRRDLHGGEDGSSNGSIQRNDARIRRVPLSVGRPSYEAACAVYELMMTCTVRDMTPEEHMALRTTVVEDGTDKVATPTLKNADRSTDTKELPPSDTLTKIAIKERTFLPLTHLHEAAIRGDLVAMTKCLEGDDTDVDVNCRAGEKEMTPLHCCCVGSVSTSSPPTTQQQYPACITLLLVQHRADPTVPDAHGRPPYYLATTEKVRDAFRFARAELTEEYCRWDGDAKVGPPLTSESARRRKDKAAEKKRKQRARQKEKKLLSAREEAERRLLAEEERKKAEAQRVRAGLQPKKASANTCDFCRTAVKRRSQMFERLDFAYCSTDCVKKHQRELSAAAAMARLGS